MPSGVNEKKKKEIIFNAINVREKEEKRNERNIKIFFN